MKIQLNYVVFNWKSSSGSTGYSPNNLEVNQAIGGTGTWEISTSEKNDWFSLLIQLSWHRDDFIRTCFFMCLCQQRWGPWNNCSNLLWSPVRKLKFFLHHWQIVCLANCETFKSYTSQTSTSLLAGVLSHLFLPYSSCSLQIHNFTAEEWTACPHSFT